MPLVRHPVADLARTRAAVRKHPKYSEHAVRTSAAICYRPTMTRVERRDGLGNLRCPLAAHLLGDVDQFLHYIFPGIIARVANKSS